MIEKLEYDENFKYELIEEINEIKKLIEPTS